MTYIPRSLRIILAVAGFTVLTFAYVMNQGIWDESNASAGRAINQLSNWVKDGKTNLVCASIVRSDEILNNSGFNGMSFEKILIMCESDEMKSEQTPAGDVPKAAPEK